MNIISKEPIKGRIEDGIDTILALEDEEFNKLISMLESNPNCLEYFHFYYTTDNCEIPSNPVKLGLEKTFTEERRICW